MTRSDGRTTAAPPTSRGPQRTGVLRPIGGLRLRELLVLILLREAAPMTVRMLAAAVEARGFSIRGRAGKVISDQLRYELARGRARRVGRGLYDAGTVTRQARWRMNRRITALRAGVHDVHA